MGSVRICWTGWVLLGPVLFLLAIPSPSTSESVSFSVDLSGEQVSFGRVGEYDVVRIPGCDLTDRVGEPQLPVKMIHVVLPPGSEVEDLAIVGGRYQDVPGYFSVRPAQRPEILPVPGLTREKAPFAEPDPSVYRSAEPYPESPVRLLSVGNMGIHRIASLLVYPLQYFPTEKRLVQHSEIEFAIDYEPSRVNFLRGGSPAMEKIVRKLVLNKEAVQPHASKSAECEYLIIAHSFYASRFQPLADWKTQKGVPARVVTTDSIYPNFPGRDRAEKIRNYIKYAYQNLGTQWVLLAGDVEGVPVRVAYAMTCEAGFDPDEDSLRADLYYSDLDGTWDLNDNGVFGEVADSVDLYPEVFVGRSPTTTRPHAEYFTNKIITYERNPPTDYQLDILFLAEVLWHNPYTDASAGKDLLDSLYVPERFDPITKLYESLGNENYQSVMDALNDGQNLINHDGHGWIDYMGVGDGHLEGNDMDALMNGNYLGIIYSIGCWVGAFHYDAISEHYINNPLGGGVGFIANSSYGWGSPGNPGFGYSDRFDHTFYEKLFVDEVREIGANLALTKAHYIPRSREENVYRIHQYQLNLLGDPEMSIWTDLPAQLTVSHPESIAVGMSAFPVTVGSSGSPEGALICVSKPGEVYERGYTDSKGQLNLDVSPSTPGVLMITVTAVDHLPFEDSVVVYSEGPYVGYRTHELSGGDGDQEMNPGEVLDIAIMVENFGNDVASGFSATLRTEDRLVTLIDSVRSLGDIQPGDTMSVVYGFSVSADIENGHSVFFTIDVSDGAKGWRSSFAIAAATPLVSLCEYGVSDSLGAIGNGVAEPGESLAVHVWLRNVGLGLAREVVGVVRSDDPYIGLTDTVADFGDIPTLSRGSGNFGVTVDSLCPTPHVAELTVQNSTSDGYTCTDTFMMVIGETGFSDDMEGGGGAWSHGGSSDFWHLTTHRAHSGTHSWYCGDTSYVYEDGMDCYLESEPIVVAPGVGLSFWHWYDVAIFGVDGLYVEIIHGSTSDTLDFIGSGGALDPLLMGNSWIEDVYELSAYPVGDTIRVRFSFVSDGTDVAEGVYVDDVRVGLMTPSRPRTPVLLYPSDGAVTGDATPTFRWSSTAEIHGYYTLQYGSDIAFSADVTTLDFISNPMYTIPSASGFDDSVYYWRVRAVNAEGYDSDYSIPFELIVDESVGSIVEPSLSAEFEVTLRPNPFVGSAAISYQLPGAARVKVTIYDIVGRAIRELVDEQKNAGRYSVAWDGKDDSGEAAGVGVYFCKVEAGVNGAVKKLILLK